MRDFVIMALLLAYLFGGEKAHAGHPVIDGIIGYGVGKAIERHQEAGERLGYPPLIPPTPGTVSPRHREMIRDIERDKFKRELERNPGLLEQLDRRRRTG
jgi:hypothetical protein